MGIALDGMSCAAVQRENELTNAYPAVGDALWVLHLCSDGSSGRLTFEKQQDRRSVVDGATEGLSNPWQKTHSVP